MIELRCRLRTRTRTTLARKGRNMRANAAWNRKIRTVLFQKCKCVDNPTTQTLEHFKHLVKIRNNVKTIDLFGNSLCFLIPVMEDSFSEMAL